jgi:hypothetical protein
MAAAPTPRVTGRVGADLNCAVVVARLMAGVLQRG